MVDKSSEDVFGLVNKEGFPLSRDLWDRMWSRAESIHPEGRHMSAAIRSQDNVPKVAIPSPPVLKSIQSVPDKLSNIQKYISELQYDYTGTQFFEIKKARPLCRLMDVAKNIIKESLPVKCLEAVILALYLTSDMSGIQRFPVAFKTSFEGNTYKHIVLGIAHGGKFGVLGLSRRATLMYKPMSYDSLADLMFEFIKSYKDCYHTVDRIKIGLPVSHDCQSMEVIMWKYITLRPAKLTNKEFRSKCDNYCKQLRGKTAYQMKYTKESKVVLSDVSDGESIKSRPTFK